MKKLLAIFLICISSVCFASPKFGVDYYTRDEIDDFLASINYAFVSGNDALTDVTGTELETLSDGSDVGALHTHNIADDLRYLKLDTSNDPLTGELVIDGNLTGADLDISAGTGDYLSTGTFNARRAALGDSLTVGTTTLLKLGTEDSATGDAIVIDAGLMTAANAFNAMDFTAISSAAAVSTGGQCVTYNMGVSADPISTTQRNLTTVFKGSGFSGTAQTRGTHNWKNIDVRFEGAAAGNPPSGGTFNLVGINILGTPARYDDPNVTLNYKQINLESVSSGYAIYSAGGISYHAGPLYLGQTDGAEKIVSDDDGTLDLYAGTSIDFHQDVIGTGGGTFTGTVQAEQLTSTDDINAAGLIKTTTTGELAGVIVDRTDGKPVSLTSGTGATNIRVDDTSSFAIRHQAAASVRTGAGGGLTTRFNIDTSGNVTVNTGDLDIDEGVITINTSEDNFENTLLVLQNTAGEDTTNNRIKIQSKFENQELGTLGWIAFGDFTTVPGGVDGGFFITTINDAMEVTSFNIDNSGNVLIGASAVGDTANAKLDVIGDTRLGDSTTNYAGFSATGDLVFVGTAGLPFGECHQTDGSTFTVTMTTQNVYVEVDAATTNISATELNLVTFPDDHYLLVEKAGKYKVTYQFLAEINSVAGGIQHVESALMVNGSQVANKAIGHNEFSALAIEKNFQGHTILDLAANDQVSLGVVNTTTAGKILTVDHLNITLAQRGGT